MAAAPHISKIAMAKHDLVPHVLSKDVDFDYSVKVEWPETDLENPGQELDREKTQPQPKVFLDPPPPESLDNLVLIMTDPDLMMENDTYFGQVRHWLVSGLTSKLDGSLLGYGQTSDISPYVGPAPLPNYLYSRPHRYVFIVARAPSGDVTITPEDLRALQEPYKAAVAGKQGEVQDLKDRWGFNALELIEKKGLKIEGVSYMRVGGSLKSAGANAAMMGQAVVDKVSIQTSSLDVEQCAD
ncbi:unnamed protein product [Periconia digitata]|uniref:PEBP-like protein n=1 Tax=Periconia digitata TaxID=1303443 RepID=A0A9W4U7L4_9PLEO|nr:unnamed protein product [Periconia digitata]